MNETEHGRLGGAVSSFYLIPVLAFVITCLWLGEVPSVLSVTGGVVALTGVLLGETLARRRARKRKIVCEYK